MILNKAIFCAALGVISQTARLGPCLGTETRIEPRVVASRRIHSLVLILNKGIFCAALGVISDDARLGPKVARLSVAWRTRATGINFAFLVGACCCFWVHEEYCPDFAYSFFGLCEWGYVLSNIAFHCSEVAELRHFDLAVLAQDDDEGHRL